MSVSLARNSEPLRQFRRTVTPTGVQRSFGDEEIIVSKTDLKGIITYSNPLFRDLAQLSEMEAIGAPHSLIRHPDMPRCVFHLLWQRIASGSEVFAYVVNLSRNGDHYWVFAHVTPSFGPNGDIIGYHSNRRVAGSGALEVIKPLYAQLCAAEQGSGKSESVEAGAMALDGVLDSKGIGYDEFVFSI